MRIERALKIRAELKTRIADLYSFAHFHGLTSVEMQESCNAMLRDYPRLPQWVTSYLDGYKQALQETLYREHLIFGGYVGDVFYSIHSNRPDYYEKHGIDPADYADNGKVTARGHYWKETVPLSNGTYNRGIKPYFVSE